jgi:gas vesicle protein
MIDREERMEMVSHEADGGHPVAMGFLAGAAIGAGLGLLFAPHKGSETRHQLADRARHVGAAGHDAYCACRDTVSHGAQRTGRYVRELADTVKRKARRTAPVEVLQMPPRAGEMIPADSADRAEMHLSQVPVARGN